MLPAQFLLEPTTQQQEVNRPGMPWQLTANMLSRTSLWRRSFTVMVMQR